MDNQTFSQTKSPQKTPEEFRGRGSLDAFLNLLSLVTLGWTALAFGGVIFQIINKYLGNPAFQHDEFYYSGAIKIHIASLLIVAPIYFILTSILHRQYKEKKLNHKSGIHRWLTYFMLFIAFANILGSLVALVFKLLDGVFFSVFILKALTVLVIALGIFGYTLYDLRRNNYDSRSPVSQFCGVAFGVLSLAVLVWGFTILGSPLYQRLLNFDRQRVQDLSNISYLINTYMTDNKKLPENLGEPQFRPYKDPETKTPYEYRVLSQKEYEICAVFSLDTEDLADEGFARDYPSGREAWYYHKKGRQCYKLEGKDTALYFEKPRPIPAN